jgi:SAM-dependent methyltransferase
VYLDDVNLLCCPATTEPLELVDAVMDADGEIVSGELRSAPSGKLYPIRNGIPRFVQPSAYNSSWDYKWTAIDRGKGLNYRILDKNDPAYRIHDLFDRNDHGGRAFRHAGGRLALDVGCGVGQYTIKLLQEVNPAKVVSVDLTGGVDVFRKIMLERFPEYRRRILIVQANVFQMPLRDDVFDYAFSLGVLMHTGDTRNAIRQVARVLKVGGQINVWVYGAVSVHIDNEEADRKVSMTLVRFVPYWFFYLWAMFQIRMFRKLPHGVAVTLIKIFSSELWYRLCRLPVAGYLFKAVFTTVMHPDRDYRYINNYDGWCNSWAETWTEGELFPTLAESNVVIRGISEWQTGIWGEKRLEFYR